MGITGEQLLELFATYNQQIWPMQIVAYVLGFAGLVLAIWGRSLANRAVTVVLAFFWLWVALLFWLPGARQGFAPSYIFAAVFLVQGVLFLHQGSQNPARSTPVLRRFRRLLGHAWHGGRHRHGAERCFGHVADLGARRKGAANPTRRTRRSTRRRWLELGSVG